VPSIEAARVQIVAARQGFDRARGSQLRPPPRTAPRAWVTVTPGYLLLKSKLLNSRTAFLRLHPRRPSSYHQLPSMFQILRSCRDMHAAVCARMTFPLSCTTAQLHHGAPRARVHPLNASPPRRPLTHQISFRREECSGNRTAAHTFRRRKKSSCARCVCEARALTRASAEGFSV
jgi:hypothetical protein